MSRSIVAVLVACVFALLVGCFPTELDVSDGVVLIPRGEGFFTFDPVSGKAALLMKAGKGVEPVYARFVPGGKDVLLVAKKEEGFDTQFVFTIMPRGGGAGRDVFKADMASFVRFSPDGSQFGVIRTGAKEDPAFKRKMPELVVVPTAGGEGKLVCADVGVLFRWFADSKRALIFEIKKKQEDHETYYGTLAIVDVASGKKTPLAEAAVDQGAFMDLSPDNKKALFTARLCEKPGTALPAEVKPSMGLFEMDLASGTTRKIDKDARYAIYSPNGKQVLLGTPPEEMSMDRVQLEVGDAGLTKFTTIASDAHMPLSMGGESTFYPCWLNDGTILYFVQRPVYGTDAKNVQLNMVGADGKGRKCVQPQIDTEAAKE